MTGHFLNEIIAVIAKINPMQQRFLEASVAEMTDADRNGLEDYLSYCTGQGLSLSFLAQCYCTIVNDTLREQIFFKRHGRYRYSTFSEVANSVYLDDNYMSMYMYGLAITTFLWPNHRQVHRFFESVFPYACEGPYLEIGPGHGVYFRSALKKGRFSRFTGVDISPTSIALTSGLVESSCPDGGTCIELRCQDFLESDFSADSWQVVVMGEVLEHVENPLSFLKKIREIVAEKGFVFITTAINSPAIDHIYLFKSPEEVSDIASRAGFNVVQQLLVPYGSLTLEESMSAQLPVNIAQVLEPVP